jgi:hypothetical protein
MSNCLHIESLFHNSLSNKWIHNLDRWQIPVVVCKIDHHHDYFDPKQEYCQLQTKKLY